jgi:patatin-like phospholipase/acyl hydrolase
MSLSLKDFLSNPDRKRRILALDGGGVRGMFTIGVLQVLERTLRDRYEDQNYRLCNYFDLIAGTSTGSIIATGLALGMTTAEVSAQYKDLCPEIFKRPSHNLLAAFFARHRSGPLTKALGDVYRDNTLASDELKTGLAVNCMRLDKGSAWILCNNPGWKYYGDTATAGKESEGAANRRYLLRDLVQASAAAPFYFRGLQLTVATDKTGKKSKEDGYFVDGGVSGNNNPALESLMAIRDKAYGFNWKLGPDQVYLLNIGTGSTRGSQTAKSMRGKPSVLHAKESLSAMINAVSQEQVAILQAMSHSRRRWVINAEKVDQPGAPYLTLDGPAFEYQRIDVRLDVGGFPESDPRSQEHASALLPEPLTTQQAQGLAAMDNPDGANLQLLQDLGVKMGERHFSQEYPRTLFDQDRR